MNIRLIQTKELEKKQTIEELKEWRFTSYN